MRQLLHRKTRYYSSAASDEYKSQAKSAPGKMVNLKHIQGDGAIVAGEGMDDSELVQQDPTDMLKEILAGAGYNSKAVPYPHLRAHETKGNRVCRHLLEKSH